MFQRVQTYTDRTTEWISFVIKASWDVDQSEKAMPQSTSVT